MNRFICTGPYQIDLLKIIINLLKKKKRSVLEQVKERMIT